MAQGKHVSLFSGYATTNSYSYMKADVGGFGRSTISIHNLSGVAVKTSILGYTLRSEEMGSSYTSLVTDAVVNSGQYARYVVGDAFEQLRVGVASNASNTTGVVNILISRKRRT